MKKFISLALLAALIIPFPLSAQTKLEDNLKAVMLLFDKNRKEAQEQIDTLSSTNEELTSANLQLFKDLEAAHTRIQTLEKENLVLRSKVSDTAVKEFETAALTMVSDFEDQKPDADAPIPDFTPAAFKNVNKPANGAEHLSDGTVLLVNLNTAADRELRMIPGIGPAMAKKVIDARPFASVWDLMKIEGMGRKRVDSISPYITVE